MSHETETDFVLDQLASFIVAGPPGSKSRRSLNSETYVFRTHSTKPDKMEEM